MSFIAAAILGGSAITAGAGIYSASQNNGEPNIQDQYTPGPDAAIGTQEANNWASQLNSMQNDPTGNFGAIAPDWNDIWSQTQQQVNNYFNGTATTPGVNDQIKGSFAQRGMSGDPASSFLMAQSGANQAQDLGNLSAQENIAKNSFAQQGQENWLNSEQAFQNATMPAQGNWSGAVVSPTSNQQIGNVVGTAASGLASYGLQQNSQNNQLAYLDSIINPSGGSNQSGSYAPDIEDTFLN